MWALDFMHDTLYDGRKFRLLNVIDEANREALRMDCGNSFPARRLVRVVDELINFYGNPRAIRMDNGPEMTSDLFVSWSHEHGIELRFIQPGKPNQNTYVERFNKSVRTEVLNAWLFHPLEHAQEVIEDWREDYNGKEFGDYKAMDHSLDTRSYFAYPFSGLKRGSNEYCNGLLRYYIPKKCHLPTVNDT